MVLRVVQLHDLSRNMGLESAVVVYRIIDQLSFIHKDPTWQLDVRTLMPLLAGMSPWVWFCSLLTRQVGKGRLAAHEAGAGHGAGGLGSSGSSEGAPQRGDGAK
jgi:hypothetical protein